MAVNQDGTDNQRNRHGELEHHQGSAKRSPLFPAAEASLQHGCRLETGENESWIKPRKQADQPDQYQHRHCQEAAAKEVELYTPSGQIRKGWLQKLHKQDGQQGREKGDEEGFSDKLEDEVRFTGPDDFSHPDFTCASGRLGGRHVDEVDTRHHKDEGRKGDQCVNNPDVACTRKAAVLSVIEVDCEVGLQRKGHQLRIGVLSEEVGELCFSLRERCPFRQFDVGRKIEPVPASQVPPAKVLRVVGKRGQRGKLMG